MKHVFFLLICLLLTNMPGVIFADVPVFASKVEIESTTLEARNVEKTLEKQQADLKKKITQQEEIVKNATEETKTEESAKLDNLNNLDKNAQEKIKSLSDYLNKVDSGDKILQKDLDTTKQDIQNTQKLIQDLTQELKAEFVPTEPTQEQIGQEAQTQIEKLGLWDTFKLNIQSVFAQTKAALASFFGNKEAAAAAHEDLINIYDQLKDYSGKAKSAGQLAGFYKELGEFSNALQMQATQLDAINNPSVSQTEKFSTLSDMISDFLSLKNRINTERSKPEGSKLTPEDEKTMLNIETQINDFVGIMGNKIDNLVLRPMTGPEQAAFDAQEAEKAAQEAEKKAQKEASIVGAL